MAVYVPFSAWRVSFDAAAWCVCVRLGWHYLSLQIHSDAYAHTYTGVAR
jgi:hypothetical protein